MAYTPYGWQNPYYAPPMPDNLMQMRQQQMQPMAPQMPQAPQNPVAQSGVQWVSGEQEARNWMIAPNAAVALWDSTAPTVYLKQADASGKPSLKIYDLVERALRRLLPHRRLRPWILSRGRSLTVWRRLWAKFGAKKSPRRK